MKAFFKQHWVAIVTVVLLAVLALAIRGFVFSFEQSYFEGDLHKPQVPVRTQPKVAAPDTEQKAVKQVTVESIQSWMTFDYINVVYKLPTNYMKDILGINNAKYPNIRIDAYAKQSNIDTDLLVTTVRTYVKQYQELQ